MTLRRSPLQFGLGSLLLATAVVGLLVAHGLPIVLTLLSGLFVVVAAWSLPLASWLLDRMGGNR